MVASLPVGAGHKARLCSGPSSVPAARSGPGSRRPARACRWQWGCGWGWGWSSSAGCPGSPGTGAVTGWGPRAGRVPPVTLRVLSHTSSERTALQPRADCVLGHPPAPTKEGPRRTQLQNLSASSARCPSEVLPQLVIKHMAIIPLLFISAIFPSRPLIHHPSLMGKH